MAKLYVKTHEKLCDFYCHFWSSFSSGTEAINTTSPLPLMLFGSLKRSCQEARIRQKRDDLCVWLQYIGEDCLLICAYLLLLAPSLYWKIFSYEWAGVSESLQGAYTDLQWPRDETFDMVGLLNMLWAWSIWSRLCSLSSEENLSVNMAPDEVWSHKRIYLP